LAQTLENQLVSLPWFMAALQVTEHNSCSNAVCNAVCHMTAACTATDSNTTPLPRANLKHTATHATPFALNRMLELRNTTRMHTLTHNNLRTTQLSYLQEGAHADAHLPDDPFSCRHAPNTPFTPYHAAAQLASLMARMHPMLQLLPPNLPAAQLLNTLDVQLRSLLLQEHAVSLAHLTLARCQALLLSLAVSAPYRSHAQLLCRRSSPGL
jgi:hypothetical protein